VSFFDDSVGGESSLLRRQMRPAECNLSGVLLDRHVWEGPTCARCGAVRRVKDALSFQGDLRDSPSEVASGGTASEWTSVPADAL
jgi:hypothetical protein